MVARFRSISLIFHRLTVCLINLKFAGSNPMGVQVPLWAPYENIYFPEFRFLAEHLSLVAQNELLRSGGPIGALVV